MSAATIVCAEPIVLPEGVRRAFQNALLTARDYGRLADYVESGTLHDELWVRLARQKLASARVVMAEDVPADVATLDSRIIFAVADGAPETRVLVQPGREVARGLSLSLTTPLGVTMLGMAEDTTAPVQLRDGRSVPLRIQRVAYQPEARGRESRAANSDGVFTNAGKALAGESGR